MPGVGRLPSMNLIDQINQHKYLFLVEISEPDEYVLRLVIEEAKPSGEPEDVAVADTILSGTPITSDEACFAYEVVFGSYVAYSVRNESYTSWDESEQWLGHLFRAYSKSHFLDYVRVATFASDDFPGKLFHYEIVCLNHVIDIVSIEGAEISILRRAQQRHAADRE
jgi:hypothetical protein